MGFVPDRKWMAFFAALELAVVEMARHHNRQDLAELVGEIWEKLSENYEQEFRHAYDSDQADRDDE